MNNRILVLLLSIVVILVLVACGYQENLASIEGSESGETLKVVATTSIVGDVVSQVGGDQIEVSVLLPIGTDPHGFNPTPQDIAKVSEADLVFANGVGLEDFLNNLIESADAGQKLIHVSDGIDLLVLQDEDHDHDHDHDLNEPHTWTDPSNVIVWAQNIERQLSETDPANTQAYQANAEAYQAELRDLDAWIREQLAQIPPENRKLVTDHALFGYYVAAYDLEQVGTLIPGYSTLAEPTAKDLAEIEDAIRKLAIKAIYLGNTVNPVLAERVSQDTGTDLIFIYTGSLSESDGEAGTYIDYMRYNTNAFTKSLTP